jgi:hypothetical protein
MCLILTSLKGIETKEKFGDISKVEKYMNSLEKTVRKVKQKNEELTKAVTKSNYLRVKVAPIQETDFERCRHG